MLIKDLERMLWETYNDWNHLLVNPRIERTRDTLSWHGYESTFLPEFVSTADVELLAELGQYTFQFVEDGALLQLYYGFSDNGKSVAEAKLAYYSVGMSPNSYLEQIPVTVEDHAEAVVNSVEEADVTPIDDDDVSSNAEIPVAAQPSVETAPSWLRMDYQPSQERGIFHSCCHLHISAFPAGRIVVKGLPTPSQFVEFIVHARYPEEFASHRLDVDGLYVDAQSARQRQKPVLIMDEDSAAPWLTHLRIAGA